MEQPIVSGRDPLGDGRRLHAHRASPTARAWPRTSSTTVAAAQSTSTRSSRTSSTAAPRCRSRCPPRTSPTPGARSPALHEELGAFDVEENNGLGKVSLIGAGMRSHPGRRRDDVPHARGPRDQLRDDLDVADQDLLHDRPRPDPRGRARRCTARSRSNASPSGSRRSSPCSQAGRQSRSCGLIPPSAGQTPEGARFAVADLLPWAAGAVDMAWADRGCDSAGSAHDVPNTLP